MAQWRKVIVSGSSAVLNQISASGNIVPTADAGSDLGSSTLEWNNLYLDGTANIDSLVADTADIDGGTVDNATIGANTHTTGKFTTVDATTDFTIGGTVITDNTITDDGTLVIASTTATSFSDGNITNVGDINVDTVSVDDASVGLDIQFGGNTTLNKITLTDNLADALNINEGGNSYVKFITSNSSEQIVFGKNSTFNGTTIADLGTVTTATSITATDLIGTNIDGIIGADTARAGTFTTLNTTGNGTYGNAVADTHTFTGHVTASANISGSSTSTGSFGRVQATTLSGDGAGITGLTSAAIDSVAAMTNNYVITATAGTAVTGEANLQFDGTDLLVGGGGKVAFRDVGDEYIYSVSDGTLGIAAGSEIDLTATTIDMNGAVDVSGNLTVGGNLDVNGTLTTIDSSNTTIADKFMILASGSTSDTDGGVIVQNAAGAGYALGYDSGVDRWAFDADLAHNATALGPDAYVGVIETGTGAGDDQSVPIYGGTTNGVGTIYIDTDDSEIWIYA